MPTVQPVILVSPAATVTQELAMTGVKVPSSNEPLVMSVAFALLLPRLDMVRHNVCQHLARQHGAGWATRWAQPKSEEELE